jgi:hypothetical protein
MFKYDSIGNVLSMFQPVPSDLIKETLVASRWPQSSKRW